MPGIAPRRPASSRRSRTTKRGPSARGAAEAAAGLAEASAGTRAAAAQDVEPRVREAALQALSASPSPVPEGVEVAASTLDKDRWPFVRAQAVAVLARATASGAIDDALARARSATARRVCAGRRSSGLARHHAASHKADIRARLDDADEDTDVRAAAAQALGAVCDSGSADRLTDLARSLAAPAAGEEQQAVALGALVGLAALQPNDLKSRHAPLLAALLAGPRARGCAAGARCPLGLPLTPTAAPTGLDFAGRRARRLVIPMSGPTRISPQEASEKLAEGFTYVDVRTTEEFEAGHPSGAVNVPIQHAATDPNADFLRVMNASFPNRRQDRRGLQVRRPFAPRRADAPGRRVHQRPRPAGGLRDGAR